MTLRAVVFDVGETILDETRGWTAAEDLYPDAVPCLRALHAAGYRIGVVGNQPARAEAAIVGLGLPLDLVASSQRRVRPGGGVRAARVH